MFMDSTLFLVFIHSGISIVFKCFETIAMSLINDKGKSAYPP